MTLIITYVSRREIYQCGDFRLTARNGRAIDYWAQKQIFVQRFGWTAVVGFCGAAETGRQYVPEWMVEKLRGIGQRDSFESFIDALESAENWLRRWDPKYRALTFSVGAFVNLKPVFVLVSNFEALDQRVRAPSSARRPGAAPRFFSSSLHVSRYRLARGRLFLSGSPASVLPEERFRLIGLFRKNPPRGKAFDALAEVNIHAAARDNTVSAACFMSYVTRMGESGGMVHAWPPDRQYLPAFIDVHGMILPRLQPKVDDSGKPVPMQLVEAAPSGFTPSERYFRVALEEKPSDPSTLSNYGNWLKERGLLDEAERAYRKAIASDPSFASAHGNLAILLDRRDDLDEATQEDRRATELNDQDPLYLLNLAFFLWRRRGEKDEAQALVERAVSLQQNAFTVGRQAWFTESALEDRAAAAELYEAALQMAPQDPWVNGRYAIFLAAQNDLAEARRHFEVAIAGDKPDLEWLLAYAILEWREHRIDVAEQLFKRAARKYPRSADALANLAAVLSQTGHDDGEVEQIYRRVLELHPGHAAGSLNLAQILFRRDTADEEAAQLLAVVANRADLPEELRMETLFYGFAYQVPGYQDADVDVESLATSGLRGGSWDLTGDVPAAERNRHSRAGRVRKLAAMMSAD